MPVNQIIAKRCTSKKFHSPHKWWSRRRHCYFHCFGRTET